MDVQSCVLYIDFITNACSICKWRQVLALAVQTIIANNRIIYNNSLFIDLLFATLKLVVEILLCLIISHCFFKNSNTLLPHYFCVCPSSMATITNNRIFYSIAALLYGIGFAERNELYDY